VGGIWTGFTPGVSPPQPAGDEEWLGSGHHANDQNNFSGTLGSYTVVCRVVEGEIYYGGINSYTRSSCKRAANRILKAQKVKDVAARKKLRAYN
jgi:hypothetical protein